MPIYQYGCSVCEREWEGWHPVNDRMNEVCCGLTAQMIPAVFAGRPNGIAEDMPKRKKKEKVTSQIYDKSGQTKLDHSAINRKIEQVNKRITKINRKYGHKDD